MSAVLGPGHLLVEPVDAPALAALVREGARSFATRRRLPLRCGGMFGSWEGPETATFWIALVALGASCWSVWYTRAAHQREERREHERKRPPVVVRFDKWLSEPLVALFTLENHGTVVVDRATVKVITGDAKLVGFAENESSQTRLREWDFGHLSPGEPVTAEFVTLEKAAHDSQSEVFVVAFQRDRDKWSEQHRVELPPTGPWAVSG